MVEVLKSHNLLVCLFLVFALITLTPGVLALGDGSSGDPFQITNCIELQDMNNNLTANYILMNDIDCADTLNWNAGAGFIPVGDDSTKFTGTFDGQGYVISDLYINRPSTDYVGLFGGIDGATVENVGLIDVNITGGGSVGGLVGKQAINTLVNNSYTTGTVTGNYHVGGLVGSYEDFGGFTIMNSWSSADVIGTELVGGLVGYLKDATITNSYATGDVTSTLGNSAGGLVGTVIGSAVISNSYSTGSSNVGGLVGATDGSGTVTNSFWDNQTSGQTTSAGGTEKTTEEMKTQSTFTGWDFVRTWKIGKICEGEGYPYLLWQIPLDIDSDEDGIPDDEDSCPCEDASGFDSNSDGCIDTMGGLQQVINTLPDDVLSDEIKNSLISKVNNALRSVDRENDEVAINMLESFIKQIEAQRGKKISEEAADMLIAYANNIISKIRFG